MPDEKLPLTVHLEELRKRLIISFIAIGIGSIFSYIFSKEIFKVLMLPLLGILSPKNSIIFTGLTEAFVTYLKVSLVSGVFLASPVIIHQTWGFLAPGLYQYEKRFFIPIVLFSTLLFIGGALFGYFVIFPFGFKYFLSFATDVIRPMPSLKEYFAFSVKLLFAFGIVFELPLFVFFLSRLGIVSHHTLSSYRRYAILLIFILAAVITPPDVVSQIMLGLPMILLYEIGIIIAKLFGKERKRG
ncbi:MAG: twin-arginine translocase subunit TatC [Thermodesulfobacteriota bacterium]